MPPCVSPRSEFSESDLATIREATGVPSGCAGRRRALNEQGWSRAGRRRGSIGRLQQAATIQPLREGSQRQPPRSAERKPTACALRSGFGPEPASSKGGIDKRMSAAEALLLQVAKKGLAGDSVAARAVLDAIAVAREQRADTGEDPPNLIILFFAPYVVNSLEELKMIKQLRSVATLVLPFASSPGWSRRPGAARPAPSPSTSSGSFGPPPATRTG